MTEHIHDELLFFPCTPVTCLHRDYGSLMMCSSNAFRLSLKSSLGVAFSSQKQVLQPRWGLRLSQVASYQKIFAGSKQPFTNTINILIKKKLKLTLARESLLLLFLVSKSELKWVFGLLYIHKNKYKFASNIVHIIIGFCDSIRFSTKTKNNSPHIHRVTIDNIDDDDNVCIFDIQGCEITYYPSPITIYLFASGILLYLFPNITATVMVMTNEYKIAELLSCLPLCYESI